MLLAAYYIHENKFGIKKQTIIFGGNYFYDLKETSEGEIKITRKLNEKYIPDFYSDENKKLVNLSAIVGGNGTGKTSLVIDISECISGYMRSENILIFEEGKRVLVFFGNTDTEMGVRNNKRWRIEPTTNFSHTELKLNIKTVYYSSHFICSCN